jgi:hypothetical protein
MMGMKESKELLIEEPQKKLKKPSKIMKIDFKVHRSPLKTS